MKALSFGVGQPFRGLRQRLDLSKNCFSLPIFLRLPPPLLYDGTKYPVYLFSLEMLFLHSWLTSSPLFLFLKDRRYSPPSPPPIICPVSFSRVGPLNSLAHIKPSRLTVFRNTFQVVPGFSYPFSLGIKPPFFLHLFFLPLELFPRDQSFFSPFRGIVSPPPAIGLPLIVPFTIFLCVLSHLTLG